MDGKKILPIPVIITKEQVKKKSVFVAHTPVFDIASQGNSVEDAVRELKEAIELFLEEPGIPINININEIDVFTSTANVEVPTGHKCALHA